MKTTELTAAELRLLISGLYDRFTDEQMTDESVAGRLLDKLYDARDILKERK